VRYGVVTPVVRRIAGPHDAAQGFTLPRRDRWWSPGLDGGSAGGLDLGPQPVDSSQQGSVLLPGGLVGQGIDEHQTAQHVALAQKSSQPGVQSREAVPGRAGVPGVGADDDQGAGRLLQHVGQGVADFPAVGVALLRLRDEVRAVEQGATQAAQRHVAVLQSGEPGAPFPDPRSATTATPRPARPRPGVYPGQVLASHGRPDRPATSDWTREPELASAPPSRAVASPGTSGAGVGQTLPCGPRATAGWQARLVSVPGRAADRR